MSNSRNENPSDPSGWWDKAQSINPDPSLIDITKYTAHSASKFTMQDFIRLKALWGQDPVTQFHIDDYVRKELVDKAEQLAGFASESLDDGNIFRTSIQNFVETVGKPFSLKKCKNLHIGPFLSVKSHLERIKSAGEGVGYGSLKISRDGTGADQDEQDSSLLERMSRFSIESQNPRPAASGNRPVTPLNKTTGYSSENVPATEDLLVLSPETKDLADKRSEDEEIVNMSLVILLDAFTMCAGITDIKPEASLAWLPVRQRFQLGPSDDIKVCEARTDGLLRDEGGEDPRILAILEVKPCLRVTHQQKIEWQEACQMAAWISSGIRAGTRVRRTEGYLQTEDKTKYRRFLISQDYTHLYITIAQWGKGYEAYLNGGDWPTIPEPAVPASPSDGRGKRGRATAAAGTGAKTAKRGKNKSTVAQGEKQGVELKRGTEEDLDRNNFLVMNSFGPYSVEDKGHMKAFIRNVLALVLEVMEDYDVV